MHACTPHTRWCGPSHCAPPPHRRDLFEGTAIYPGGSGTVFDFYLDSKRNFAMAHWDDLVPQFKFKADLPYFQILVPTTDTTRYAFLLKTCLEVRARVCVCAQPLVPSLRWGWQW